MYVTILFFIIVFVFVFVFVFHLVSLRCYYDACRWLLPFCCTQLFHSIVTHS